MLTGTAVPFAPAARGSLSDVSRRESFTATTLDTTKPPLSWLRTNLHSYSREDINTFVDDILDKLISNLERGTSPILFNINVAAELRQASVAKDEERAALRDYALRFIHSEDSLTLSAVIAVRTIQAALNEKRYKFHILREHNVSRTAKFNSVAEFTALFAVFNQWIQDLGKNRKSMLNAMIEEKLLQYQNTNNKLRSGISGMLFASHLSADFSSLSSLRDASSSSRNDSEELSELSVHPFGVPESEAQDESEEQEGVPMQTIPTTIVARALREYASSDLDIATTATASRDDKSEITTPFSPLTSFTEEDEPGNQIFKSAEEAAIEIAATPDKFELLFRVIINAIPSLNQATHSVLRTLAGASYDNSTGEEKIRFLIAACQNYEAPTLPKNSFFACCGGKAQPKSRAEKFIELVSGLQLDQITPKTADDVQQLMTALIGSESDEAIVSQVSTRRLFGK